MAKTNTPRKYDHVTTHEGAPAFAHLKPIQALRRSVASCLLWEDEFYESGEKIADRILSLIPKCDPHDVAALAVEARSVLNLRHAPLLLVSGLSKHAKGKLVGDTVKAVVQRADELAELVSVHAKLNGVTPDRVKKVLPAQMKKGLAAAFLKFDAYQLAKYNRDGAVKLRDVLFMAHPKPANDTQSAVWKQLIDGTLAAPDTWEVALSGGADKRATFERLLTENKLGYLALLRNLRNMDQAGVDMALVRNAILARKGGADRVLPFRFIAAARACPQLEPALDEALCVGVASAPKLKGRTVVLVDVSGSMDAKLSGKSDLTRMDAAAALASVINAEGLRVFSFSAGNVRYWGDRWNGQKVLVEVPPRRGLAGIDAVVRSQSHGGTMLGQAVTEANDIGYDRLIVVTDEQSADVVPNPLPGTKAYMINVASAANGVGYGKWTHIDGFSESVIRYIHESESLD